jgi:hypothetical protein
MYCPRCGQQQISDEMRFCSRCGLPMSGLAEWLAGSGTPAGLGTQTQVSLPSPRRKGIRRAAKLMFFSAVLFPIFLAISIGGDEGGPMVVPFILFFVSLVMMLYARLFSSPIPRIKNQTAQTSGLGSRAERSALPPASDIPMYGARNFAGRQVRTAELAQPGSVTENTTRLLDEE